MEEQPYHEIVHFQQQHVTSTTRTTADIDNKVRKPFKFRLISSMGRDGVYEVQCKMFRFQEISFSRFQEMANLQVKSELKTSGKTLLLLRSRFQRFQIFMHVFFKFFQKHVFHLQKIGLQAGKSENSYWLFIIWENV